MEPNADPPPFPPGLPILCMETVRCHGRKVRIAYSDEPDKVRIGCAEDTRRYPTFLDLGPVPPETAGLGAQAVRAHARERAAAWLEARERRTAARDALVRSLRLPIECRVDDVTARGYIVTERAGDRPLLRLVFTEPYPIERLFKAGSGDWSRFDRFGFDAEGRLTAYEAQRLAYEAEQVFFEAHRRKTGANRP